MDTDKPQSMLEAFLKAKGISDTKEADRLSDERERAYIRQQRQIKRLALKKLSEWRPDSVSHELNIPTRLKTGELDNKTEVHKNFKNYDHSLEIDRWKAVGGFIDPIEMGDMGSDE